MADPYFYIKVGGGGGGSILLAQGGLLPSVISSFSTQNKGGEGEGERRSKGRRGGMEYSLIAIIISANQFNIINYLGQI